MTDQHNEEESPSITKVRNAIWFASNFGKFGVRLEMRSRADNTATILLSHSGVELDRWELTPDEFAYVVREFNPKKQPNQDQRNFSNN
jgi:hypothetical protein